MLQKHVNRPHNLLKPLLIVLIFLISYTATQEILTLGTQTTARQTQANTNQFIFELPSNFFDSNDGLTINLQYSAEIKQKPSQKSLFLVASSENFFSENYSSLDLKYVLMYKNNPLLSLDTQREEKLNEQNVSKIENQSEYFFTDYTNFAIQNQQQNIFIGKDFLQNKLNSENKIYIQVFLDDSFFNDNTYLVIESNFKSSLVENDFQYTLQVKGQSQSNFCDFIGCGKFNQNDKCKQIFDNQYTCTCNDQQKFGQNCNSQPYQNKILSDGDGAAYTVTGQKWTTVGIEIDEDAGTYQIQLSSRKFAAFASFISQSSIAQQPNFLESLYNLKESDIITNFTYEQRGTDDEEVYLFMGYYLINQGQSEQITVKVDKTYDPNDRQNEDFAEKTKRLVYIIFILVVVLLAIFILAIVIRICISKRNPQNQGNLILFRRQNHPNNTNKVQTETIDKYMPVQHLKILQDNNDPVVQDEGNIECMVCLENLCPEDEIRKTVCNHIMHSKCIDQWLIKHTNCPFCRTSFLTKDVEDFLKKKEEEKQNKQQNQNQNQNQIQVQIPKIQNPNSNRQREKSSSSQKEDEVINFSDSNKNPSEVHQIQESTRIPQNIISQNNKKTINLNQIGENQIIGQFDINNQDLKNLQNIKKQQNKINKLNQENLENYENQEFKEKQEPNLINAHSIQIKNNSDQFRQKKKRQQITITQDSSDNSKI